MSTELNLKQLTKSTRKITDAAKKYGGFTLFIAVLCIYGYLVFSISTLSKVEPTDEQVAEQTSISKRLKIDQDSIDKVEQLKDQNVGVQSLFKEARENPFQD